MLLSGNAIRNNLRRGRIQKWRRVLHIRSRLHWVWIITVAPNRKVVENSVSSKPLTTSELCVVTDCQDVEGHHGTLLFEDVSSRDKTVPTWRCIQVARRKISIRYVQKQRKRQGEDRRGKYKLKTSHVCCETPTLIGEERDVFTPCWLLSNRY